MSLWPPKSCSNKKLENVYYLVGKEKLLRFVKYRYTLQGKQFCTYFTAYQGCEWIFFSKHSQHLYIAFEAIGTSLYHNKKWFSFTRSICY